MTFARGLINAIAALNGSYGTIELDPASYPVSSNYVIPENISLLVNRGAIFVVDTGATLIINAEIKAGRYQIFGGAGTAARHASRETAGGALCKQTGSLIKLLILQR